MLVLSSCFFQRVFPYYFVEYVDYWFDSIHCYRTAILSGQEQLNASFDPPVIVVFTGTDRYEQVRHYSMLNIN